MPPSRCPRLRPKSPGSRCLTAETTERASVFGRASGLHPEACVPGCRASASRAERREAPAPPTAPGAGLVDLNAPACPTPFLLLSPAVSDAPAASPRRQTEARRSRPDTEPRFAALASFPVTVPRPPNPLPAVTGPCSTAPPRPAGSTAPHLLSSWTQCEARGRLAVERHGHGQACPPPAGPQPGGSTWGPDSRHENRARREPGTGREPRGARGRAPRREGEVAPARLARGRSAACSASLRAHGVPRDRTPARSRTLQPPAGPGVGRSTGELAGEPEGPPGPTPHLTDGESAVPRSRPL